MDIFNYEWAVDTLDLTFDDYNPRAPGVGVCRAAGSPGLSLTSPVWRVREFESSRVWAPPATDSFGCGQRDQGTSARRHRVARRRGGGSKAAAAVLCLKK